MCIICVDFNKKLITVDEARSILGEAKSTIDKDHLIEIEEMLEKKEED